MSTFSLRSTLIVAAIGAAGCGGSAYDAATGPIAYCSAVAPVAIIVAVRDSVTLLAKADSASGTVRDGAYVDTLRLDSPTPALYLRGGQRLGTYDVTVQRPGYGMWTRSGVQVTQTGACGSPITVSIAALLKPLP